MPHSSDKYLSLFKAYYKTTATAMCFAKNAHCSENIINAHSIQNSFVLDQLETAGHVYVIDYKSGGISFKLLGRGRASTFTGFCSYHDTELFKAIDFKAGESLDPLSEEQKVLFHFRALTREYWSKLNVVKTFEFLTTAIRERNRANLEKIYPFLVADAQIDWNFLNTELLKSALLGHTIGSGDIKPIYESLQTQIKKKKYHLTKSIHFIFNVQSPFAVSSFLTPTVDFNARPMNDFLGRKIHFLGLNIFPHAGKTHVLLTWHKHSPFDQIGVQLEGMNDNDRQVNLSKFILAHCENIVFDQKWLDPLSQDRKELIKRIFTETATPATSEYPFTFYPDINLFV